MNKESKIYVAGHRGLVGSAILNLLSKVHQPDWPVEPGAELDDPHATKVFSIGNNRVRDPRGSPRRGIVANNTYRADFIYRNLQIQNNVIGESYRHDVKKLLFLGSTCVYPREGPNRFEDSLLTSPLEYTNEPLRHR